MTMKLLSVVTPPSIYRLVDKHLGMVTKIRKDSKTLQVFTNTMAKGVGKVTGREGRDSITVKPPNEIIIYQQHMGGVHSVE